MMSSTMPENGQIQSTSINEQTSLLTRTTITSTNPSREEERGRNSSAPSTFGTHHDGGNNQWKNIIVLLLGVFLVNLDSAILLAMFRQIASDFDRLSSASWIITAYLVGLISVQPLYGKLSDIYGRKPLLMFAYICYCLGGILGGSGVSFPVLLLGRFICGVGNAGIAVLISTLVVDLVPLRDVAVWRGYVYTVNQVGRAVGPSLGGIISDQANWRWALLYQVPVNLLTILFIWTKMTFPQPNTLVAPNEYCRRSKLWRIDFAGSVSLALANVSLLLFLSRLQSAPGKFGQDLATMIPMSTWLGCMGLFVAVEGLWAEEPIIPLRLLTKRNVVSSYAVQVLQTGAQMALYTSIPLYFRVAAGDSSTKAAFRLLVITIGTVAGGLLSGFVIKRTGLYRLVTAVFILLSNLSFLAVLIRWHGPTSWFETMYGFPIGLGFGVSLSATYIGLAAELEPIQVAVGTSGFYLCLNLGSLFGVSAASMLIITSVEQTLKKGLAEVPNAERIIHDVTSNFDRINRLPKDIADVVLSAYTKSFANVWLFSLTFGCMALLATLIMREGQLDKREPLRQASPAKTFDQYYRTVGERDSDNA